MRIGLIDVDGHNFPNLPLMKLSAWHKEHGDTVEWYEPLITGHCDKVYMSKVFTFTEQYKYPVDADEIIKSGTGYFYPDGGPGLPYEIEHHYPDYNLYKELYPKVKNTAYGFLTRGCPRGCDFCIVKDKEGKVSRKVADLSEFWRGKKNIELLDPNFFACPDWRELSQQLIQSNAYIEFNQGIDIRIMNEEKTNALLKMKMIIPKMEMFRNMTGWKRGKVTVYVLVNFNTTIYQDMERVRIIRSLGFAPYIMVFEKDKLPKKHPIRKMQRLVNNKYIFYSILIDDFEREMYEIIDNYNRLNNGIIRYIA